MSRELILLATIIPILGVCSGIGLAEVDPVCWWRFEGNAADSSGQGCDGTEYGGPAYAGGYDGLAIVLDGADDYVEYSLPQASWSAYTVALWVRTDTFGQDQYSSVFNNNSSGSDFQFDVDGSDMYRYQGSESGFFGPVVSNWVHLAAACDGTSTVLYYDGELVASVAAADTDFGRYAVGVNRNTTNWFAGMVDELRIYDRALTKAEIQQLAPRTKAVLLAPDPGAVLETSSVLLRWTAGRYAADVNGHHLYLSDSFEEVDSGAPAASLGLTSDEFYYLDSLPGGKVSYWRVDEVNDLHPTGVWEGDVWSFTVPEETAWAPYPANGAVFVELDVTLSWQPGMGGVLYDVYLGTDPVAVAAGTGETYRGRQTQTTYPLGPRLPDTEYFWRIDTVKEDSTIVTGPVWSFRTEPVIAVTDPNLVGWWKLDGADQTRAIDWSGHENHGYLRGQPTWETGFEGKALRLDGVDDWVAIDNLHYAASGLQGLTVSAWIRTSNSADQAIASFDRNEYWRLEINGSGGGAGQVGWSVMTDAGQIDLGGSVRVDDGQWHHVAGLFDSGTASIYVDGRLDAQTSSGAAFGTGKVRYGFIGARSEASSFDGGTGNASPFAGDLDEVRIYNRALRREEIQELAGRPEASTPSPADLSQYDGTSVVLSWHSGKYAAAHNVYFGTDAGDLPLVAPNLPADSNTFGPVPVEYGRTYYWVVDEVNDPCIWAGQLWTFQTQPYAVVDDFDSYVGTSGPNEPSLLSRWTDGASNGTGATIFLEADFAGNSMRCEYDNTGPASYSEAELIYDSGVDWTAGGLKAIALEFHGDPNNTGQWLYLGLEDTDGNSGVVRYEEDPNALRLETWQHWNVALEDFLDEEVDLTRLRKLIIGVSGSGGSGVVFVDQIRLYPSRCVPEYAPASFDGDCITEPEDLGLLLSYWLASAYDVSAVEPNQDRLRVYYKFDETAGTIAADSSGRGYHGTVDPNGAGAWDPCGYDGYCLAFDGNFAVSVPNDVFSPIRDELTISVWLHLGADVNPYTVGRTEFGAGPADSNEPWDRVAWIQEKPGRYLGKWGHYAFVKDAGAGLMRIYHNGLLVAQQTQAYQPIDGAEAGSSTIGASFDGGSYYKGKLDELRIYDYALPHREILYLAHGPGSELHQPLQPVLAPVDPYDDGIISLKDFSILGQWWLQESLWP